MNARIGAIANALSLAVSPLASAGADPAGGYGGGHADGQAGSAPMVGGGHFHGANLGARRSGWRAAQPL